METTTPTPTPSLEHRIVLNVDPHLGGPFVCCCGLVLWDAEAAMHHLTECEPKAAH